MRVHVSSWAMMLISVGLGCGGAQAAREAPTRAVAPAAPVAQTTRTTWTITVRADDVLVETSAVELCGSGPAACDAAVLDAFVTSLAARVDRPSSAGHIDVAARAVVEDGPARALDVASATERLRATLARGDAEVELVVEHRPRTPAVVPEGLSLAEVLGEFTTPLSRRGGHRHRAHNVDLAAGKLDGVIIPAHGTLSFNAVVGPRDRASGYRYAPVILDGELQPGIGGGICQAASTLYAASFFGGLEFDAYQNHSRLSTYIDGGLDATVVWPDVDLVVRNPFDFPLFVSSETTANAVTIRIYGARRPRTVTWERALRPGARPELREVFDTTLPVGARVREQAGRGGRTVDRIRRITEGARTWEERERLTYSPVPEVVRVGTGPLR